MKGRAEVGRKLRCSVSRVRTHLRDGLANPLSVNRRFTIPVLIFAPLVHLASVCTPTLPQDSLKSYSQAEYSQLSVFSANQLATIDLFLALFLQLVLRFTKSLLGAVLVG